MRLALGGWALAGTLLSTIGDFIESEYELSAALRRESLVNLACAEKESLTRLAIEKQEQAIETIATLIEKEIADAFCRQASLCLIFDEINRHLAVTESKHELQACLKAQRVLTGLMNDGITSVRKVLTVEFKKFSSQSTKLLEA